MRDSVYFLNIGVMVRFTVKIIVMREDVVCELSVILNLKNTVLKLPQL